MKYVIILLVAVFSSFHIQAQSDKGVFQIGIGGLPIIYPGDANQFGYSIRGNIGYFPTDRLSVGLFPFRGKVNDIASFGGGLYFRYYLTNRTFSVFLETGIGFGSLQYDNSPEYNGTLKTFNFGPGIHYIFKNKIAIEFLFQYANLRNISFPDDTNIGDTFIPTIGVQYFITK